MRRCYTVGKGQVNTYRSGEYIPYLTNKGGKACAGL